MTAPELTLEEAQRLRDALVEHGQLMQAETGTYGCFCGECTARRERLGMKKPTDNPVVYVGGAA
jgi:hypothetical protein